MKYVTKQAAFFQHPDNLIPDERIIYNGHATQRSVIVNGAKVVQDNNRPNYTTGGFPSSA